MARKDEGDYVVRLKRQIREMQLVLEEKNRALDAMWWVWCSGGCSGGVSRWKDVELTEEIVAIAEQNTNGNS